MKKLLLMLSLIIFSFPAFSQWGVKGGVNISNFNSYHYADDMFSIYIGGTYDYKLSRNWFFQPSLLFTTVGFNIQDDKTFSKGGHVKIHALEAPLNISFRPRIINETRLLTDFGLYTRYGLFGNKTYEFYSDTPKVDESPYDAYNRFDLGFNLGIGLQQRQYYGMFSFHRGLSRAEKGILVYHKVLRFGIGYYF